MDCRITVDYSDRSGGVCECFEFKQCEELKKIMEFENLWPTQVIEQALDMGLKQWIVKSGIRDRDDG